MKKRVHILKMVLFVLFVSIVLSSCDDVCIVPSDNNSINAPKGALVECSQLRSIYSNTESISPFSFTYDEVEVARATVGMKENILLPPVWKKNGKVIRFDTKNDVEYKIQSLPAGANSAHVALELFTGDLTIPNTITWKDAGTYVLQATGKGSYYVGTVITKLKIVDPKYIKVKGDGKYLPNQVEAWAPNGSEGEGTKWSCVYDTENNLYWTIHKGSKLPMHSLGLNSVMYKMLVINDSGGKGYCGRQGNWRIPETQELKTLYKKIDVEFFPNEMGTSEDPSTKYWGIPFDKTYGGSVQIDKSDFTNANDEQDNYRGYTVDFGATTDAKKIGVDGGKDVHYYRFVSGPRRGRYYKINSKGTRIESEYVEVTVPDGGSQGKTLKRWPEWVWLNYKISTGKSIGPTFQDTSTGEDVDSEEIGIKWSCVYDSVSGLYWEIKADKKEEGVAFTGREIDFQTEEDNHDALEKLRQTINGEKGSDGPLCGFTGWRMPTIDELATLYDQDFMLGTRLDYFPDVVYMFYSNNYEPETDAEGNEKKDEDSNVLMERVFGEYINSDNVISFLSSSNQVVNFGFGVTPKSNEKLKTAVGPKISGNWTNHTTLAEENKQYFVRMVRP